MKPFSPSAEENRRPILEVLRQVFTEPGKVLEIASGTGQHGVYFAEALRYLDWQCTEVESNLPGLRQWVEEAGLPNLLPPLELHVAQELWPLSRADGIFCANAVHIMSWAEVEDLFRGIGRLLPKGGKAVLYGPFHYNGHATSESNRSFDQWLRDRDPKSGVRDFEAVDALARAEGLTLLNDFEMPVNNRTLVWRRDGD